MIDFTEIDNYETFEEICENILIAEGLLTRRLGRGPGQLGKDVVAFETISGPLSTEERRKWLVECKFTESSGSIGERDVENVRDRIESQEAYGFMLFTNARLKVNLEKTLYGLNKPGIFGIQIWTADRIAEKIISHDEIFRTYFPKSFNCWLKTNRLIYMSHIKKLKSPLVHILSCLKLIRDAPYDILTSEMMDKYLDEAIITTEKIVDEFDEDLSVILSQ